MKNFVKFLYSSKMVLLITFLLNVITFLAINFFVSTYAYGIVSSIVTLIALLFIMSSKDGDAYKVSWLLIIFILPIFGCTLYAYLKVNKGGKRKRQRWNNITFNSLNYLQEDENVIKEIEKLNGNQLRQINYLKNCCSVPAYQNTTTKYLNYGKVFFKEVISELKKAEKYIFMEFFIFKEGIIFDELFQVLKEKSRKGVEVKILYDDYGCLDRFKDKKLFKKLANYKIQALPFNKLSYHLNAFVNYRTHRKIVVIDGKVAFTGGINVGDEYANLVSPYGHWKDVGVKLAGDAVWGFTVLFLNSWQFAANKYISDYSDYYPNNYNRPKTKEIVQPFGTSPLLREQNARDIYLNLISSAQKSVLITTPYFIIDAETANVLKIIAKSGVNVSIIVPGIPDKKIPYYMARSRFSKLIKAGVKIYQYTPGFIHAKTIVVDDCTAVVGTINMDFRSMYLHFENGVLIQNSPTISEITQDIKDVISQSHLVTLKDMKKRKLREKIISKFLLIFEPLM